jgi:restriction system protein
VYITIVIHKRGGAGVAGVNMARRYWVWAPYNSTKQQIFDKVWDYDLTNETIAFGSIELGDVPDLNEPDFFKKYVEVYGKDVPIDRKSVWKIYHEIALGDIIIARRGRKKIIGIGEVTGKPFFDVEMGKDRVANMTDRPYPLVVKVRWEDKQIEFEELVFPIFTLWEISEEKYRSLIERLPPPEEKEEDVKELQEFVLEKYLEEFIVTNFKTIFGNDLELYIDSEGIVGRQFQTEIGNIDILARQPNTNSFVVIELKKGRESDKVVGQILRYMGWVKENLCQGEEDVKGVIITSERDERLKYALKPIQQLVSLKYYRVDFQLID